MEIKRFSEDEIKKAFQKFGLLEAKGKEVFDNLRSLSSAKKKKHKTFDDIRTYSKGEENGIVAKLE